MIKIITVFLMNKFFQIKNSKKNKVLNHLAWNIKIKVKKVQQQLMKHGNKLLKIKINKADRL